MAEVHHFTHGFLNPGFAYATSVVGAFIGLYCTARARAVPRGAARIKWLTIATVAIGGAGVWLAHFTAMLGFDVVDTPIRYAPGLTAASLALGVGAVGLGLFLVGYGEPSTARILRAGGLTGTGLLAMHYIGMMAVNVAGEIRYAPGLVAASAIIAVVAATVALWFTTTVQGWGPILAASALMAGAVSGMHYTGMAAARVHLDPARAGTVTGVRPLALVVGISVVAAVVMTVLAVVALQAMTTEEFAGVAPAVTRPAGPLGASFAAPLRGLAAATLVTARHRSPGRSARAAGSPDRRHARSASTTASATRPTHTPTTPPTGTPTTRPTGTPTTPPTRTPATPPTHTPATRPTGMPAPVTQGNGTSASTTRPAGAGLHTATATGATAAAT